MGLIDLASGKSLWRGYECYLEKHVLSHTKTGENGYDGRVAGNNKIYDVHIDLAHPRKSKCSCPHAAGRRIICKHMVSLYFTVIPKEAERYYKEVVEYEEEQERELCEIDNKIIDYLKRSSKSELEDDLYNLLYECPEWLFYRFISQHID